MKKLLTIILMLGASLPALASESKIICHTQGQGSGGHGKFTAIFILDSDKKTIKQSYGNGEFVSLPKVFVTDEAFGDSGSDNLSSFNVDRSNGEFRRTFLNTGEVIESGTCAPFKQAL